MTKKEKIPLPFIALSITIIFLFAVNTKYFGIPKYYPMVLLCIVVALFCTMFNKIKFRLEHSCTLVLFAIACIHLPQTMLYESYQKAYSLLILITMFFLFTLYKPDKKQIRFLSSSFIISGAVLCFLILVLRKTEGSRYTVQILDFEFMDPNFLSAYLIFPALLCFNRVFHSENKLLYSVLSFLMFVAVLLTGSRAAMLALGSGIFIVVPKADKKFMFSLLLVLVLCAAIYFVIPEALKERFFSDTYNDDSNLKRLNMWRETLYVISLHPFIGESLAGSQEIVVRTLGGRYLAHNSYLELLLKFGIIGFSSFLVIIYKLAKSFIKKTDIRMAVLLSLLFVSGIISYSESLTFWLTMTFLAMLANFNIDNPGVDVKSII